MAQNYGVLKGKAVRYERDNDSDPHSELLMDVAGVMFRIAINVRSSRGPVHQRLIEYVIKHDLRHPIIDHARTLPVGWNDLKDGREDEAAIDYIRSNLFRATEMKPIPHLVPGENNDLFEFVEAILNRAKNDQEAVVYAFGGRWGPDFTEWDEYFRFIPSNGVHLIHMNQGGSGDRRGTYSDGALIVDFVGSGTTTGLFLKFQNQRWHTDETDATPIAGAPAVPVIEIPETGTVPPWPVVAADSPYHLARIVAAMVTPREGDPGKEFVTILNISDSTLDLTGWSILDRDDKIEPVSGSLEPGHTTIASLSGAGAQLSNKGGTITLLDSRGLKVDGVAYTADDAKLEGKPIVFL
jgi:uncharacterized protein YukJ